MPCGVQQPRRRQPLSVLRGLSTRGRRRIKDFLTGGVGFLPILRPAGEAHPFSRVEKQPPTKTSGMPTQTLTPRAWLLLPGHGDAPAHVRVIHYPLGARVLRTALTAAGWGGATLTAFFVTMFDPFLSSIPLILGAASTWRAWRGQFRVQEFAGPCPRCRTPLALSRGTRIASPHRLVCYACHHEPQLALTA
jgi:hypothetical protein